jgi:hypothetical protein
MRAILISILLFYASGCFAQKTSACRFKYCRNYRIDNLFRAVNQHMKLDESLQKYDTTLALVEYDLFNPTTALYFGKKNNRTDVYFYLTQNQEDLNYICIKMRLNADSILLPVFSALENLLKDSLFFIDRTEISFPHPTDISILMKTGKKCAYNGWIGDAQLKNDTSNIFEFTQIYRLIMDCIAKAKYITNETYCRDVVLKQEILYFKKTGMHP